MNAARDYWNHQPNVSAWLKRALAAHWPCHADSAKDAKDEWLLRISLWLDPIMERRATSSSSWRSVGRCLAAAVAAQLQADVFEAFRESLGNWTTLREGDRLANYIAERPPPRFWDLCQQHQPHSAIISSSVASLDMSIAR